jgi:hypothetical protein
MLLYPFSLSSSFTLTLLPSPSFPSSLPPALPPSLFPSLPAGGQILKRLTTKFLLPKKEEAAGGKQEGGKEEGLALYVFEGGKTEEIKTALRAAVDAVEGEGGVRNTEVSVWV